MKQFKISNEIYTVRNQSINSYLEDIRVINTITPEEEHLLAIKMSRGCQVSKNIIIKANLRFVVSVAKSYHRNDSFITLEDLINEGNLGMIEATEKFDPSHGFKFISFAVWHIRRRIRECITKNSKHIRTPDHYVGIASKIAKVELNYLNTEGRLPTPIEVEEVLQSLEYSPKIGLSTIKKIMKGENSTTSLNQGKLGQGSDSEFAPIDYIEHSESLSNIKNFEYNQFIKEMFKDLNGTEIDMLSMRIGIPPYDQKHSYEMVGNKWGYSSETTRQRIKKTLTKLKRANVGLLKALLDER
jgi:RNA polymerase primary sigma factor